MADMKTDSKPSVTGHFVLRDKNGNIKQEGEIEPKFDIEADSVEELLKKLEKAEEELAAIFGVPIKSKK